MNLFFDANLYSSIFSKKAIKKPELAEKWLASWRDINGDIRHDLLYDATTNNQAEYGSCLMALRELMRLALLDQLKWMEEVTIYGDSQIVIYQLIGKYHAREQELVPLWTEALNLVRVLQYEHNITVKFRWVPRALNNKALNLFGKIKQGDPNINYPTEAP